MCSLYMELLVEAANSDDYSDGRPKEVTFYNDDVERDILKMFVDVACYYTVLNCIPCYIKMFSTLVNKSCK